jgi:gliding motility-associated-like protein
MIYNRYGEMIYKATGKASWDGTFKGKPQPTGAYVYIIQPTGNPINDIRGTVMIIR